MFGDRMSDHLAELFPPMFKSTSFTLHPSTISEYRLAPPWCLCLCVCVARCKYACFRAHSQDVLDQTQNLNYRTLSWVDFLEVRLFT